MKSKSIVFFFAVLCLFLSHCTNVGSYYSERAEPFRVSSNRIDALNRINSYDIEMRMGYLEAEFDKIKKEMKKIDDLAVRISLLEYNR